MTIVRRPTPCSRSIARTGIPARASRRISAYSSIFEDGHDYLDGVARVDNELLGAIGSMVAHLEVSARRAADWEQAILGAFSAWRQLRAAGGWGTLTADLEARPLTAMPAALTPFPVGRVGTRPVRP